MVYHLSNSCFTKELYCSSKLIAPDKEVYQAIYQRVLKKMKEFQSKLA